MKIIMVTPAPRQSRAGNRTTAQRWARILRELGHRVTVATGYQGQRFDLMVGLHAWRSHEAIAGFRGRCAGAPLIVAMTGTDLYHFIHSHPAPTLRSIELADRLIVLHDLAHEALPSEARGKVHVIYQSAPPLPRAPKPSKRHFEVCVVGHLRDEKDPLRTALATRRLEACSRIRVLHYGKAHDERWADRARAEMARNGRYRWLGEVPQWRVRRAYARCRLMVLSSKMEGGANVVSEAVVAGLPVIASDIPGSVGLLGRDYEGYYPVRATAALAELLHRAETDPSFLQRLRQQCEARSGLFTPEREREAWEALIATLA